MATEKETDNTKGDEVQQLPLPKQKWRPGVLSYIFVILVLLGGLAWGGVWLWTRSARQAFEAELAAIKARGEATRFADYRPQGIAENDGTVHYQRALHGLEEFLRDETNPVAVNFNETTARLQPPANTVVGVYTAEDLANIRLMMQQLAEARRALSLSLDRKIRLDVDYNTYQGVNDAEQRDSATLRSWFRVLNAEGYLAINDGDADRATTCIEDMLKLSAARTNVTLVINQFTNLAIGRGAVELNVSMIEHLPLSAEHRARLDKQLSECEDLFRFAPAVQADRAALFELSGGFDAWINELSTDDVEFLDIDAVDAWLYANLKAVRYNDFTTALQMMSRGIEFVDQPGPEGAAAAERFNQDMANLPGYLVMTGSWVSDIPSFREAGLRYRQQLRGMRLALRVDAAIRDGRPPSNLHEVLDATLPEVPPCMFWKHPLALRNTENGFVIYSLGADGVDDAAYDYETKYGMIEVDYPLRSPATPQSAKLQSTTPQSTIPTTGNGG